MEYNQDSLKKVIHFWHYEYIDNSSMIGKLAEFERDYDSQSSINWYTRETFLYRTLTKYIKEELSGQTEWAKLGDLLVKTSHFDKDKDLLEVLLEQASEEDEEAIYCNCLGVVHKELDNYETSIEYH